MHFSIPDTQEFMDEGGNAYVGYNIHINGLFHCTVRYKQLHNLHEQLSKDLDISLPIFPPKKFFPLTITQQEERRLALEKYIQSIGQNIAINNSEILNGFLLNAQEETIGGPSKNETLDIFLMNGSKIFLNVSTGEHSGQVLKTLCKHIKLLDKYHFHFALFIIMQEDNGSIKILRKLQDFESPFITYKNMRPMGTRVVLRKSYWDTTYDIELLNDPIALNLLYTQAMAEIHAGWIPVTKELQQHLESLEKSGDKEEYLNVARTLKYYGYIQFAPCFCDYPQHGSRVLLAIGRNELNLRILSSKEEHEVVFKVSRMRCWRITTMQNGMQHCEDNNECNLELSFEYLVARNELQWITIASEQAILMSVCLQAMIDELLQKCVVGSKIQTVPEKSWTYVMRDGQSRVTMGSPSRERANSDHSAKSGPIIKKLTDKLSAVKLKKSDDSPTVVKRIQETHTEDFDIMENNAFRMIGDDDL
ncbi:sorting nexin-17 [Odontomachus brunneus]|uniref:sorting nexin-17 n=1 Tax=Odontomachus brunneus TaxID=486640 RepID=UPI0013F19CDC|nr:sorting nexin-17 [Odontomachus brunneus]XP_032677770.1 sorting nexin-17 [Odontomachus brunneus]XP_032677771.1 sorting nexin-17 [Odontomachus brunneus]